ncbi:MAG: light harvesting protein subunit alpha, partial [Solirubrobacteraceae bacterium]
PREQPPTEATAAESGETAPAADEPVADDSAPAAEESAGVDESAALAEERAPAAEPAAAAEESAPERNGTVPPTLQPGDPLASSKEGSS